MIGEILNVRKEFVVLFVKKDEKMMEISPKLKLYEINGQYWNNWRDV